MPQTGSDSVIGNLLARRHKLSAARQKLGLEAPQRAGIQGNLRPAGVPARTPTQPGAAPARAAQPAAKPAARPAAPSQPAAAPQPAGAPEEMKGRMLTRATEFLGMVQHARRRQSLPDRAVPGRSRQLLSGGV